MSTDCQPDTNDFTKWLILWQLEMLPLKWTDIALQCRTTAIVVLSLVSSRIPSEVFCFFPSRLLKSGSFSNLKQLSLSAYYFDAYQVLAKTAVLYCTVVT